MPLTTDDLRKVIHDHIVNKCPIEVWEREYKARTHLTCPFDNSVSPPIYTPGHIRPMFTSKENYKFHQINEHAFRKGKPDFKSIYRRSKRKDKVTKNVVREFSSTLILMDHTIVVTSDPTDSQVISIDYVYNDNEFLKEAQEKLNGNVSVPNPPPFPLKNMKFVFSLSDKDHEDNDGLYRVHIASKKILDEEGEWDDGSNYDIDTEPLYDWLLEDVSKFLGIELDSMGDCEWRGQAPFINDEEDVQKINMYTMKLVEFLRANKNFVEVSDPNEH